jgi:predicted AlkP superfamily phosphohydrolase/phosphomutase
VIILSDHGFGRQMGNIYPNSYLKRWGYLVPTAGVERDDKLKYLKNLFRNSKHTPVRKLYATVAKVRSAIEGRSSNKNDHSSWTDNASDVLTGRRVLVDWNKTKVATVWAYQMGFLYVNVVGRGPMGVVEPGEEYESLVAELISKFEGIRHPRTGKKLLDRVARGSEIYPTPADGILLPDVVLVPVDGYGFAFTISDVAPEISDDGSHRHNGVLVMRGKGLKRVVPGFFPQLVDLAPTILHMLGLPVPADMDGRVLEEIFSDTLPVHYEDVDTSLVQDAKDYTEQETELIEQRLKGLGYLE